MYFLHRLFIPLLHFIWICTGFESKSVSLGTASSFPFYILFKFEFEFESEFEYVFAPLLYSYHMFYLCLLIIWFGIILHHLFIWLTHFMSISILILFLQRLLDFLISFIDICESIFNLSASPFPLFNLHFFFQIFFLGQPLFGPCAYTLEHTPHVYIHITCKNTSIYTNI